MGNNCPDLATTKAVKSSSRLVYSVIQRSSAKLFGLKDAVAPPKVLPERSKSEAKRCTCEADEC